MAIDFPASPTLNDVFTVGNVTYVWDGTKWTASVTGGISLDKIEEGNTSAEVIDTGSDGRFVVTTEGTERLRVTNTGLVGIGTVSPVQVLDVRGGANRTPIAFKGNASGTGYLYADNSSFGIKTSAGSLTGTDAFVGVDTANTILFLTSGTDRARIDSSGRLGIGTSSPSGPLDVVTGSEGAIFRFSAASTNLQILPEAANGNVAIRMRANSGAAPNFQLRNDAGSNLVTITNGGSVGIGTTSPSSYSAAGDNLVIADAGNCGITLAAGTSSTGQILFADGTTGADTIRGIIGYTHASNDLFFGTNAVERARIDASGRLLVGTSTALADNTKNSWYSYLQVKGNSSGTDGRMVLATTTASASVANGTDIGNIYFLDSSGGEYASIKVEGDGAAGTNDYPGRLVFSTTADGASTPTERMRITEGGRTYLYGSPNLFISNTAPAGTTQVMIAGGHSASSVTASTLSFRVFNNGNVQNSNNSYGSLSDIKLKENVVDANSQWDDLKALQVRNYNFKEGQTHTQIGLVAQEVELVSPGLVSESPDRDEDGNDLGTVTKSVNYSVLYMKAVKALQETMERIETLEGMVAVNNITIDEQQHQLSTLAARLTALENA
jgi:hypothetical protein